jgi:hypothetical protein
MPTRTYEPIAAYTVATTSASYTFSSIPGTYTDLYLIITGSTTTAGQDIQIQFNGDTGTNYSRTYILGNGSAASSGRNATQNAFVPGGAYLNTVSRLNVMNYSNATTFKTVIARHDSWDSYTVANVGLWRNTAAITSLTISTQTFNMNVGSTFTLYGIKAA